MLEAKDITVVLGRHTVLHKLDFCAQPGKLTAIVGPNGSGKTTLLKAMTGDVPFTGQVHLNGQDITALKPWEVSAMRAVLPQASTLAFPFTVSEVVHIGLHRGISGICEPIAMAALARVGLGHYAERPYQELSGGEQQRVQLARVLAQVWHPVEHGEPRWLFLDEPVSALDIGHQLQVMRLARTFADQGGGVVAVMHDLNLTAMFADAITLMAAGRPLAEGTPAEVMQDAILSEAYGCTLGVSRPPLDATPYLLPHLAAAVG